VSALADKLAKRHPDFNAIIGKLVPWLDDLILFGITSGLNKWNLPDHFKT
jgi:hypothetical protein